MYIILAIVAIYHAAICHAWYESNDVEKVKWQSFDIARFSRIFLILLVSQESRDYIEWKCAIEINIVR